MYRVNKHLKVLYITISFSLVIIIVIAYAAFTSNLNINGTGVSRKSNFDIYFSNLQEVELTGTAEEITAPTISGTTISSYDVKLVSPGDSVSYTFDVVNNGDYNATITSLSIPKPECGNSVTFCSHLSYTLKYTDGTTVATNDALLAKETKTMVLKLNYDENISSSDLPSSNVTISNLGIDIVYSQDNNALVSENGEVGTYPLYKVGDKIRVNNEDYWVISNSPINQDYVVALKDEPLTVAEVNEYGGVGTADNHVNRYTYQSVGTAYNLDEYGGIAYYSSLTCGYSEVGGSRITSGCSAEDASNYLTSDIKYVVDKWSTERIGLSNLKEVDGYKSRLLKFTELQDLGCTADDCDNSLYYSWIIFKKYNFSPYRYNYWTMDQFYIYNGQAWCVSGTLNNCDVDGQEFYGGHLVRPVINIYKSAL